MTIHLGAIADDFTGATDIACALAKHGMSVAQVIRPPTAGTAFERLKTRDALVVALKTRTCPVSEAVEESLTALRWLQKFECRQYYFKYCSTFDSTAQGNIGPVADALLTHLGQSFAIVCPAFPENDRTVYQGHLFVGDRLLSESPLKNHPITPMRDSNLVRLMSAQSSRNAGLIDYEIVSSGAESISSACENLRNSGIVYGIVDALDDRHIEAIGAAARSHHLVTGGSALGGALAANLQRDGLLNGTARCELSAVTGRTAIIAGSCSESTIAQLAFAKGMFPHYKIDARRATRGDDVTAEILDWAVRYGDQPLLIYSSDSPEKSGELQNDFTQSQISSALEATMAQVAKALAEQGTRRFVVAGGETSGAVVSALNVTALEIGPEIDTGVPWTVAIEDQPLAFALKSGNFGREDFFVRAVEMLS